MLSFNIWGEVTQDVGSGILGVKISGEWDFRGQDMWEVGFWISVWEVGFTISVNNFSLFVRREP